MNGHYELPFYSSVKINQDQNLPHWKTIAETIVGRMAAGAPTIGYYTYG